MKDKTVLITGGTGTIGSMIAHKLTDTKAKSIIIVSNDEDALYHAKKDNKDKRYSYVFADVRNPERLKQITIGVDIVIHCAALKHVPLCEEYPIDAVHTNTFGTLNMIRACASNNVDKFLMVSTDKAVYPLNTMGATKMLAERITLDSDNLYKTKCSVVRFGNVIRSRGSVIPLWEEQAKAGKDITITDKNMKRYFMEACEAAKLILHACKNMKGGEIFIKNMREKSIYDMAKKIADKHKVKVIETGARPGEKLRESLLTVEENSRKETKDGIITVKKR